MKLILVLSSLVLCLSVAAARETLVSTPEEIKSAMKHAVPGDTVTLKDGEWIDDDIVIEGNGTEESPIVIRAQSSGNVVFKGGSHLRFSGSYLVVTGMYFTGNTPEIKGAVIQFRISSTKIADHCRLTNCAIVDYNPDDKHFDNKWVSMYGRENRVDHNYFKGKNNQGCLCVVWLDSLPNNHRIDHNYFGPRPEHDQNGAEIIRVGTSEWSMFTSRTIVEENYFYSCDGEIEIISNKSCENIYRYNTFVECAGSLTLRHGNRCRVYGNWFFGHHKKKTGGVRVIGEDHKVYNNYFDGLEGDNQYSALSFMLGKKDSKPNGYFQVKNAQIVFNTFVDNKNNIVIGVMGSDQEADLPPFNCIIADNLIVKSRGTIINEKAAPQNSLYKGNMIDGNRSEIRSSTEFSTTDVEMKKDADGIWRPTEKSAVIGRAEGNFSFVTDDIDGQPRGMKKDIGADQYSLSPVLRQPMTDKDAGISWTNH